MKDLFIKIALIEKLVGADAPIESKVRAWLNFDRTIADRKEALRLAVEAIRLDRLGCGWHTTVREHVDGPDSPFVEVTIGHLVDRLDLIWFMKGSDANVGGSK